MNGRDEVEGIARGVAASPRQTSSLLRNVYVCYFLSGALGLVYQILWLRKLLLVFGSTVHAVSTVLTVFFGGLALGSWLFGRLIDRGQGAAGLRWYAALEAGVGLYAFITPPLFDNIHRLYIPLYQASGFSTAVLVAGSFVCSALILLIPTTLLGGTFPVLSRFLIRSSAERGVKLAGLYGINTAGAMAGTLLVYYQGLPVLGLSRTLVCAGVLNLGIGLLCWSFDRRLQSVGFHTGSSGLPASSDASGGESRKELSWLLAAFGLSGFSAMVYEVAWTRLLSLVLGSSIYAFCIMLATFLGGMAVGSFLMRRDLRLRPPTIDQFIRLEVILGWYGLASVMLFNELPEWFVRIWPLFKHSLSGLGWLQLTLSAAVMLLPTITMGALFPLVSDLVTKHFASLGQRLGTAYAVNTLGGILGSFLSGFVLIPFLGLPWAIVAAALVNLAAGSLLYTRFGWRWPVAPRLALAVAAPASAMFLAAAVLLPAWQRQVFAEGVYLSPESYQNVSVREAAARRSKLLYYRDSFNATVSVHQSGEQLFLKVGGKTDASTGIDMGTQVLAAHIPMLLHSNPKQVLVIGLGSGVTLGHVGRYPVSTIHCAEIDPAVIEGSRLFKDYNFHIHDDPRVRIFSVDGRNFLLASPERYDVIISEPSNPWMAGLAYLFTQEFYQLAKARLAAGGIMCQWLQLYRIFPSDVKLMLKTFHDAFPYVSVWSSIPGDVLLVGSMEPQRIDYGRLAERMADPAIQQSLAVAKVERPDALLQLFWLGNAEVEQLTADISWLHRDDQPSVEFNAPRALYLASTFSLNYLGLERFKAEPSAIVSGYTMAETSEFDATLASLWESRGERDKELKALEDAVKRQPDSKTAWLRLGEVHLQAAQHLKAKEALTQAAEVNPTDPAPLRLLAKVWWREGRLDEAQRLFEQAAGLKAPDAEAAREMGDCLTEARQFALAAECYRSSMSQGRGDQPGLVLAYAKALKELKQYHEAERVSAYGASAFPDLAAFPLLLAQLLLEQGRGIDAEPWFVKTLTVAPNNAEAYYGLGWITLTQGRTDEAIRHLRRALAQDPYHREALKLLYETGEGKVKPERSLR